jgi:hypothetical protein
MSRMMGNNIPYTVLTYKLLENVMNMGTKITNILVSSLLEIWVYSFHNNYK